MTILDSFTILFSSNAAQVKKDMGEAEKSTKDFQQTLNTADKTLGNMGTRLIELGVAGVSAFAGFEGIKNGLSNAQNFNLELDKTRKLTGANAEQIEAWDQALQKSGAARGDFTAWYTQTLHALQAAHLPNLIFPNLLQAGDTLKKIKDEALSKGATEEHADQLARDRYEQLVQAKVLPEGFYDFLSKGAKGAQDAVDKQRELINATKESEKAARSFENAWKDVGSRLTEIFTKLEGIFLPFLTRLGVLLGHPSIANFFDFIRNGDAKAYPFASTNIKPESFVPGGGFGAPSGNAPLGIRSNNPGNIQPGGVESVYGSLSQGIAAEKDQLRRYGAKGRNTLWAIAQHWPDQAHRDSWLATVAKVSGLGVNQPLDLNDQDTLNKISNGINAAENGMSYNNLIGAAKGAINGADNANLNGFSGGGANNSKTINIGSITVKTQATDADGIAAAIDDKLNQHFRNTVSNYDDMEIA